MSNFVTRSDDESIARIGRNDLPIDVVQPLRAENGDFAAYRDRACIAGPLRRRERLCLRGSSAHIGTPDQPPHATGRSNSPPDHLLTRLSYTENAEIAATTHVYARARFL